MTMNRREVLRAGAAAAAATALPGAAFASGFAPQPGAWRSFQTVTRLEIAKPGGPVQAWVPLPALNEPEWFRPAGSTWTTNAKSAEIKRDAKYGAEFLHVVWAEGEQAPVVEVTSKFSTRDRAIDLSKPGNAQPLSEADRKLYTSAPSSFRSTASSSRPPTRSPPAQDRRREGARDLRVDRRQHLPQCQDARLRRRRHRRDAEDRQPRRQVRRPQRALCRPRARRRPAGARRLRHPRGAVEIRLQEPGRRLGDHHQGAALPRRGAISPASAGCRSIRPTCARSCSRSRPAICRSTTRRWWRRARRCSAPGRRTGSPTTSRTTSRCRVARGPKLGFLMYPQAETVAGRLDCLDPDTFNYKITSKELTA